ncbi:hypothetical protein IMG5_170130 [Ichthyophthirius multifiliis]|uniref:Uncharacterized protein n=1 Tax=Ichthyophthirius multifiliis TaxID=5932 RepID=G0R1F6_ICHMU|nr:hypothetical protein IMG5_170130 [Ichthyophthirius multifiliis]EGR28713.1 hypothetical protein IMG5_170130 [Ichthyophthirius multifiliis]|eukprot:XP_004029949.1 hypothetical protein IMG5_170130 [Ichthyophthirius multifiliis]
MHNIKKLDFFGTLIYIRYKNDYKNKTYLGSIISLGIIMILIAQTYYEMNDIVNKYNPVVTQNEIYKSDQQKFILNQENLTILFSIENNQNNLINDNQYFQFEAFQYIKKIILNENSEVKDQITQKIQLKISSCENIKFNNEYYDNLNFKNKMFCFNYEDNNQQIPYIQGDQELDNYSSIKIYIKKCKNEINDKCKSDQEIQEYINDSKFNVYFNKIVASPYNFTNPFQQHIQKNQFYINNGQKKEIQMKFKNNYVLSDIGMFFQDKKETKKTLFTQFCEQIDASDNQQFLSFELQMESNMSIIFDRKYKKIQNLLSSVGGIAKSLVFIGYIFIFPINQLNLNINLIKQLFQFNLINISNKQNQDNQIINNSNNNKQQINNNFKESNNINIINLKNQEEQCMNIIHNNKIINNTQIQNLQSNKKRKKKENNLNNKKLQITNQTNNKFMHYTFFDYFCYYLWPFGKIGKKKKVLQYAIKKIQNQMDIIQIINKLQEIDKLKTLLLDKDQIKLFEYLPKQVISVDQNYQIIKKNQEQNLNQDDDSIQELFPDENLTYEQKASQAINSYQKIKEKNVLSYIDKKLIQYFNLEFFQQSFKKYNLNIDQIISNSIFYQKNLQNKTNKESLFKQIMYKLNDNQINADFDNIIDNEKLENEGAIQPYISKQLNTKRFL